MDRRQRETAVDAAGLAAIVVLILAHLHPTLLFTTTLPAGGDLASHYPTALWLREHLGARLRLHGWWPGAYLGQPLLLYYFPLPFLMMAALGLLLPMPIAFKLVVAASPLSLPLAAYVGLRLLRTPFPTPLLAAAAATVFLFIEENPVWGGTLASVLTGELSYSYGLALALLFLGLAWRDHADGRGPWRPAALLALVALAHGYAVLWAGLASTTLLVFSSRRLRTLLWLGAVATLAFGLAGFFLVPLLAEWSLTTPYAAHHIPVGWINLFPPLLWSLFGLVVVGVIEALVSLRRGQRLEEPLVLWLFAALAATGLALAAPRLGVIDIRFVPMAQLALGLAAIVLAGRLLAGRRFAPALTLVTVALALAGAQAQSRVVRHWAAWDFGGLEVKEGWPAVREVARLLAGSFDDPRVKVEHAPAHESAGTTRVFELLPLLSGRATLEGVYNQASLSTHAVYTVAAELDAVPPNPFPEVAFPAHDLDAALTHLALFNVREIVAASETLKHALAARSDVERLADVPPYTVFRLRNGGTGYVEPLAYAPVRSCPRHWRKRSLDWLTRRPVSRAVLVFTDDPRFTVVEPDDGTAPPEIAWPTVAHVRSAWRGDEELVIHTDRIGHPLLVKVAFHSRWRAEGADGPYLASPSLMVVVPTSETVRLRYATNAADLLGLALTLAALAGGAVALRREGRPSSRADRS